MDKKKETVIVSPKEDQVVPVIENAGNYDSNIVKKLRFNSASGMVDRGKPKRACFPLHNIFQRSAKYKRKIECEQNEADSGEESKCVRKRTRYILHCYSS